MRVEIVLFSFQKDKNKKESKKNIKYKIMIITCSKTENLLYIMYENGMEIKEKP